MFTKQKPYLSWFKMKNGCAKCILSIGGGNDDSFSTCGSRIVLNELSVATACQCGHKLHKTVTPSLINVLICISCAWPAANECNYCIPSWHGKLVHKMHPFSWRWRKHLGTRLLDSFLSLGTFLTSSLWFYTEEIFGWHDRQKLIFSVIWTGTFILYCQLHPICTLK